jgi:hypothetical protein
MAAMSGPGQQPEDLRSGPSPAPVGPAPLRARQAGVPAAAWPLLSLIAAAVVGVCVGAGTYILCSTGNDDGWAELGAFLLGIALGITAFAASHLGGLAVGARRAFPHGHRMLPVVLSLAIPALLLAAAVALAGLADSEGTDFPRAMGIVAFIGAVAAAPASFAWAGGARSRRRLAVGAGALIALMVVSTAAEIGLTRHRLAQVADRMPFVLFAGGSAEAPFDGWRRDAFRTITISDDVGSIAPHGNDAVLKYFASANVVFVTMHTDIGPCQDTPLYTCRTSGTLQGNEIRRYERIAPYGAYPHSDAFDVLVYPDGSAVSVNDDESRNWPRTPRDFTTTQVLQSLVRVDWAQFELATGSTLRLA